MEEARTQYTDVRGTAAADWHEPTQIQKLAQAGGIDTSRYFPVGVVLYGESDLELAKIYAVDTTKAGGNTFDAVHAYLKQHPGDVEVFDCTTEAKIASFVKRLEVVLGNRELLELI
jgi:hypothetical protein